MARDVGLGNLVTLGRLLLIKLQPAELSVSGTSLTDALLAGGLVILLAIFLTTSYYPPLDWGGDSAMYLLHAENLAAGVGYNDTGYIQNPRAFLAPQAYPPGFALAIAPLVYLFGVDITLLQAVSSIIYCVGLAAFAALIRPAFDDRAGGRLCWLALIGLVGFNPAIVAHATALRADGLFFALVCIALWLIECVYRRLLRGEPTMLLTVLAGVALGAASLTRVFGPAIIAAVLVFELVRFRRLTRPCIGCVAVAMATWALVSAWVNLHNVAIDRGGGAGYWALFEAALLQDFLQAIVNSFRNSIVYGYYSHHYLWPRNAAGPLAIVFVFVCAVMVLLGFLRRVASRLSTLEIFCLLYFVTLLPWLARAPRYLLPLAPFIFFYAIVGLEHAIGRYRRILTALMSLIVIMYIQHYVSVYADYFDQLEERRVNAPTGNLAGQAFDYIARQTPKDSVILFRKPRILSLMTDRPASTYADSLNRPQSNAQLLNYARSIGVDYILEGPIGDPNILGEFVEEYGAYTKLVYRNADFALYAFDPES